MEDRDKIKKMLSDGKINSDQAVLFLRALKESVHRRKRIFRDVLNKRQERQRRMFGFLAVWLGVLLVGISVFLFIIGGANLSRDVNKAIIYFNRANGALLSGQYEYAIDYYKKGIRQAPRLPIGYSLLGMAYKIAYYETQNQDMLNKADEVLKKAEVLVQKYRGGVRMNGTAVLFLIIFGVLVVSTVSLFLLLLYNFLVKREEKANEAWAHLSALCQRKADLIPVLAEAVKGYASHEKNVLESVISARSKLADLVGEIGGIAVDSKEKIKEFIASKAALDTGIGKINALAEQYPALKANENYLTMQKKIEVTEDEIAKARKDYNHKVQVYNSGLRLFPLNLMAVMFQFHPKAYFEQEG